FKTLKWESGQQDQMHDTYRWVCRELPDHPMAHLQYGRCLVTDHWFKQAEPVLRRAIALAPDSAQAHGQLGAALSSLGRHDEALDALARAVELDPEDPEILEIQGEALLHVGRPDAAVAPLQGAHARNPRRSGVLGLLTIAMTEAEDPDVARIVDYDSAVTEMFIDVPDGYADLQAFNAALHAELEARHKALPPPINQTMRGGTQIPDNLFNGPTGTVALVKTGIVKSLRRYIAGLTPDADHPFLRFVNPDFRFTGAWSTILRGAGYDASHIHNEGWLSGVYYVKVPDLPDEVWQTGEGCLQIGAPPDAYVSARNRTRIMVRPEPGKLVLFPSYVWHGVRPFTREDTRHSIAFDVI
ncbi:MAG: putative 2OG-Fe(II) oxygenase, partial [Alphaproteobacteria bacterium]